MSFELILDLDKERMDRFVEEHAQNNLFQCSNWALVKNNWQSQCIGVEEDGKLVATALLLIRPIALGKTLMYIPRGPIMDYKNEALVTFVLDALKRIGQLKKCMAIRFDPNIYSKVYRYEEKDIDHPRLNEDIIEFLKQYGAKHSGYTTNILDTTQPRFNAATHMQDDFFETLDHKTKQSIRTAERKGAKLYEGHEYLHDFATAMQYTEDRKGVMLRNEEYFKQMADIYGKNCIIMVAKLNFAKQIAHLENEIVELTKQLEECTSKKEKNNLKQKLTNDQKDLDILLKERENEGKDEVILAGKLAIHNKNRMEYVYMGNNAKYLRLRSSYYLYDAFFHKCQELGISYISMGGIEGTLDDGLTGFKSNWHLEIEEYIGEFNIVLNKTLYNLFTYLYPKLIQFLMKIKKKS